jgi:hypothetical protein
MEMRQITTSVLKELIRAGFDNNKLSVHRGHGTASFWIYIKMEISRHIDCSCGTPDQYGRRETCQNCKDKINHIHSVVEKIALITSERDKMNYEYQAILIQIGFKEAT